MSTMISLRMPDEMAEWLKAYAEEQQLTVTQAILAELEWLRRWDRYVVVTEPGKRAADWEMLRKLAASGRLEEGL